MSTPRREEDGRGAEATDPTAAADGEEVGDLEAIQRAVGHGFRTPELLVQALTHTSYRNEAPDVDADNERLEFLGDAVLELTVSEALFRRWPSFPEGRLTRLRASLVNTGTLAEVSRALGLGQALRLGRGEEGTGGRDRRSTLADVFEATLGAVYLDGGLSAARGVVERALIPRMDTLAQGDGRDSKTRLQEWAQERHRLIPSYEIIDRRGPDHAAVFTARVVVGGEGEAQGQGRSKKEAHRAAAAALLASVGEPTSGPGEGGAGGLGGATQASADGVADPAAEPTGRTQGTNATLDDDTPAA